MDVSRGLLHKIDDGMSFVRSVIIFLLGFGMVAFDAFTHSEYGTAYFNVGWYSGFFRFFGLTLLLVATVAWVTASVQIICFGKTIFSMKTEIKQTKNEIESYIFLRLKGTTGAIPPDSVVEMLRRKPHLIPLMEEFLMIDLPFPGSVQDIDDSQKATDSPATK